MHEKQGNTCQKAIEGAWRGVSTFALVKAKGNMCILDLKALVAITACLLQVKEDGYVDKGMRIEMALSNLHAQKHRVGTALHHAYSF